MAGRKALWARPACDPDLPERLRQLATWRSAERQPGLVGRWRDRRELSRESDRVIFPHDLHDTDRLLLARAQVAIETILTSQVRADGLIEADELVLRRHEWDIATAAREMTGLRRLHAGQDPAGLMTAAVLGSQQRAISLATAATDARIRALEQFADQVAAADAASRDWREALELAGLNDKYLDIVARTAADHLAVAELEDLTDRAAATVQILQDSLRAAAHSAEILALPG